MAYLPKDLSVLAYANGFTLWHYTTQDPELPAVLETEAGTEPNSYFNPAWDMLRAGDIILANVDTTGANPHAVLLLVAKVATNEVTFTNLVK